MEIRNNIDCYIYFFRREVEQNVGATLTWVQQGITYANFGNLISKIAILFQKEYMHNSYSFSRDIFTVRTGYV